MTAVNVALLAVLALSAPAPQDDRAAAGANEPSPVPVSKLSEPQKLSYALGVNIGRSLLADGLDPDPELFLDGLRDALTERPVQLSDEELSQLLADAAARVRKAVAKKRSAASLAALDRFAEGDATTTRSTGELVRFETTGTGPKPSPKGRVRLHYAAGIAGEGTPFFTTRRTTSEGEAVEEPIEVAVEELLPGLRTVLPEVPVGSTVTIGLPPDRAYGPAGGPAVPPNTALLVRVELLAVLPVPESAEPAAATDGETP
ncbi:FKBP-type peptidyl-prolyl cis-trans isomerase N-terminal domain-containing protein [Alienimonas chondri]|uniref:Peptidyl-prolyl cis-trans isomerase n=1 Tax=Alienimonas chondri TaxID=2681879 RepID=A0ABX1VE90_9PLAN|nr:FKBP-type peptidyl-prolyl cis-trans isomerase N-terminal domain-containing protein [Alienimonas chondri]NNJ26410.1 hypothetical protein [Alienimonas chondri]